jgi:hypothetical protein
MLAPHALADVELLVRRSPIRSGCNPLKGVAEIGEDTSWAPVTGVNERPEEGGNGLSSLARLCPDADIH